MPELHTGPREVKRYLLCLWYQRLRTKVSTVQIPRGWLACKCYCFRCTKPRAPNLLHQSLCTKPRASKTSCTKPLAPKLKHLVPKLVHQTSCTKARTTNLLHQTLCTKPCATNLVHQTLCIKPCAPNLILPPRKYSTVACVKWPLSKLFFKTNYCLMQVKNIAECILQYFWPSFSYQLLLGSLFWWLLSGCYTQVLLYLQKMLWTTFTLIMAFTHIFKMFHQATIARS